MGTSHKVHVSQNRYCEKKPQFITMAQVAGPTLIIKLKKSEGISDGANGLFCHHTEDTKGQTSKFAVSHDTRVNETAVLSARLLSFVTFLTHNPQMHVCISASQICSLKSEFN